MARHDTIVYQGLSAGLARNPHARPSSEERDELVERQDLTRVKEFNEARFVLVDWFDEPLGQQTFPLRAHFMQKGGPTGSGGCSCKTKSH